MEDKSPKYPRPKLFCSKCLGFARCRYNGITIDAPYIKKLDNFCDILTVCPEVEIGLGVPRKPIRIVRRNDKLKLIQSETGNDLTEVMENFCRSYVGGLQAVDGFILKFKSPSCGVWETKYYSSMEKGASTGRGPGLFGKEILDQYPEYPMETETRLTNFTIREHFLLSIFTLARFRETVKKNSAAALIYFHAKNKLLLLAYSQQNMRIMGKLIAAQKEAGLTKTAEDYNQLLLKSLSKTPRYTSHINVIQHAAGYFSKSITANERNYIKKLISEYADKKIPLSALRAVMRSYIIRFGIDYLEQQTYFDPYPEALIEVTDSGKGRDLKHI